MFRDNKGVSLVMMVVTIAVMVIMISITVSSSIKSVEETYTTKINNEIKDLKEAVNDRIASYERNETLYPIVGQKIEDSVFEYIKSIDILSSEEINEIVVKISKLYSQETKNFYRLVGRADAEKLGVESISAEHYYVVDYNECEVYGPVNIELVNNGG